jgi:hypothetical protein
MSTRLKRRTVLDFVPATSQNPLLGGASLHSFCCSRFSKFVFPWTLERWLLKAERGGIVFPAWSSGKVPYYSSFQIWQFWRISGSAKFSKKLERPIVFAEFDALVRLLVQIQDYYLPLVRSDQRNGTCRDYGPGVDGIAGTSFCTTKTYILDALHQWKNREISCKRFEPARVLSESGLSPADLREWICRFASDAESIDPMKEWQLLARFVEYSKRQKLKYDALLAQDFMELAEILRLFHADASDEPVFRDISEWTYGPISDNSWLEEKYGDSLHRPCGLLEYVLNYYGLNAKPQAIIFTEGEEWRALGRLYEAIGAHPSYSGIEFRSLGGIGEFSLSNWQAFIEYMHEKQTIVYFVVDREGRAASEARRLLKKQRRFVHPTLKKVIPSEDRLCLWSSSFEEANFSDEEIANAFGLQGMDCSPEAVTVSRGSRTGLIKRVAKNLGVEIDKRKLVVDLVDLLISWRQFHPNDPRRPIEGFVYESAQLIILNHQPTEPDSRNENYKTGLLG